MKQKVWQSLYLVPVFLAFCLVFAVVQTHHTEASINPFINFQGKLTNPDSTNLTNGSYTIVFSLYTVASGGANVWTETKSVTVTDGIFQTSLGDTTALPGSVDFNTGTLYLGIKVGTDAEMTPRVTLTAAPYAFNSDKLGGITSAGFVQLSPGSQQTGFVNISGNATVGGTYNGNTLTSSALTFSAASATSIQSASSQALTLDSGTTGGLNLGTGSNAKTITLGNVTGATSVAALVGGGTNVFSIQGASSAIYLQLDTTNNRLYVGNPTADATGVLLVLDSKNTAGDPATGVNGAEYYNSSENRYRCYRGVNGNAADGAWEDCGIRPIDRSYELNDEFISGGTTTGTIGNLNWSFSTITSAATYSYNNAAPAVTSDRPGILRIQTAATLNTGSTMQLSGLAGAGSMALGTSQVMKTSVAASAVGVTTVVIRAGIHNETTTTARPTTGVWWEYDPAVNANWQYCYVNAAPAAICAVSATAPVVNTFNQLEIRVTGLGVGLSSADFFVNGVKSNVSTITINTTNLVSPALTCYTTAATARGCFVDYYQIRGGSGTYR